MSDIEESVGGISPNNSRHKLISTSSSASLDTIRETYTNASGGDNDSDIGSISYSTTKSTNGSGKKLDLFVNQEPLVIERLKKSIRVFVSQEVHGHMQQYKEKIQFLKDTFRTQTQLYEEKISILEEENNSLTQTNSTLKNEVVMWQKKLQEQTDAYSKERQWLLEQLAAYAYTLQYVQNQQAQPATPALEVPPPSISVQPPIVSSPSTESAASTSSTAPARRASYALSISTSTSDLPSLFPSPRPAESFSAPASHSVCMPPPPPVKLPPPPPAKLPPPPPPPSKDLFAPKPMKLPAKSQSNSAPSTPKKAAGAAFGDDLIDQIRNRRVDSTSRAAAFAKMEEERKTAKDTSKIQMQQLNSSLQGLKKTGGVSKVEEQRKKTEEIVRQKVFTPGKLRPSANASTSTDMKASSDDIDLDTPISKMVTTFINQSTGEDSDEEDDGKGLGDMLRSMIPSGRNTPKGPP